MSEAAVPEGARSRLELRRLLSGRLLADDRLARRAARGDSRAFAAIYDRYHQDIYRFCLATVGNSADAQDALQNTMVKVLRALPGEERRIELKPWLYRIAHNESVELLRRRRATEPLDAELPARDPGLAEEALTRERLRRLFSDLDELPERQREALVMRELGGLGFAEVGEALGTSGAVARQTVYEARLGLREMDSGREMSCATVTRALSDADGRVLRRRDIRAHLRGCAECRRFREEIGARRGDLAALSPLPAVAAAGLLHGLLGGGSASGGGLAGSLGAGAGKTLGASAAIKSAAAVAVVAAVGVGAADRGGLVHLGPSGGGAPATVQEPASGASEGGPGSAGTAAAAAGAGSARGGGPGALGAAKARAAKAEAAPAASGQSTEASAAGSAGAGAGAHPHGAGHAKQHPAASAHGQWTAAAHRASRHGHAHQAHHVHPPHAAKPPHPAHPESPHPEKPPPSQAPAPSGTGGEAGSRGPATRSEAPREAPDRPETNEQP